MNEKHLNKITCIDNVDGCKELEKNSIDLIVTSPPYDNIRTYKNNTSIQDKFDGFSFNFKELAIELYRIMKPGGVIVWVVGDGVIKGSESGNSFRQALFFKEIGFNIHDTMIYEKNTSSFPARRNGNRYTQIFEYMFIFSKGKPRVCNLICDKVNKWAGHTNWGKNTQRDKNNELKETKNIKPVPKYSPRNNIWRYVVGKGFLTKDKIAHKHPAIFPEKLAEDHILTWTNKSDVVFDPFVGSGTTAKMSILNERNFIGFDESQEYCDISIQRCKDHTSIWNEFLKT